ncbi:regulatory protein RecX [Longirhabdus pacifica]|uniref:regulatory protein RecX n=1 Tax=Longirhabdus pacifica TaxID=2305227 RepID=UPI001008A5F0|nr:RecX family transcriptional regulator [Longirhabdus pacifica]
MDLNNNNNKKIITAVVLDKEQKRYQIYIEDQYAFTVHEDILVRHQLIKGLSIDAEQMMKVTQEEEINQAYQRAMRWISYKMRTAYEIEEKLLAEQYDPHLCAEVIQQLKKQQYVDDQSYAKMYAKDQMKIKKKGRQRIEIELKAKKIKDSFIQEALSELNSEEEFNVALQQGIKKWHLLQHESIQKRKHKTISFLLRKGYTMEISSKIVKQIENESNL